MGKYSINIDGNKVVLSVGTAIPLGISKCGSKINYSIAGNKSKKYHLAFYNKDTKEQLATFLIPDEMRHADMVAVCIDSPNASYAYAFLEDGKLYKDIYAKSILGKEQWSERSDVIYTTYERNNDLESKVIDIPMDEMIIYKLHVRGFTNNKNAKVEGNGTFKGLAQKAEYLKDLGVNTVLLMPAYEFEEVIYKGAPVNVLGLPESMRASMTSISEDKHLQDRLNYWGYTDAYYMLPKKAYCAKKDASQVEFKNMVKIFHDNNIQVFMEFYFVPGTNHIYIVDVLRHWAEEYGIDGVSVNFDVAPISIVKSDPVLSRLKIIGDRWEFVNECSEKNGNDKRFAVCNDNFMITARKFLKSDEGQIYDMSMRVRDCRNDAGIIHYLANHNTLTLSDMVTYDRKHNEANGENNSDGTDYNYSWNCGVEGVTKKKKVLELRRKQIKNALTFLFLSQGIPMLYAGDEMGHTTNGNNNPYCQDNEISYINWNNLRYRKDIYEYVKMLIEFRKKHKILSMKSEARMSDYKGIGCPDVSLHGVEPWKTDYDYVSRCFSIMYNEEYVGENEDGSSKLYIAYNMHWEEKNFNLPANKPGKRWELAFTTDEVRMDEARSVIVKERTVAVFLEK